MKIDMTHGVYRVLSQAEQYRRIERSEQIPTSDAITTLGVLLTLLDEDECRAADWLETWDINRPSIFSAFPVESRALIPHECLTKDTEIETRFPQRLRFLLDGDEMSIGRLEPSLLVGIFTASQHLHDHLPQVVFATEHLLYALTLTEDEIGTWLRNRSVTPEHLLEKICHQEGINLSEPEIISFAWDEAVEMTVPESGTLFVSNACIRNDRGTVYRILDASANRAIEAIRVLEDYLRFGRNDAETMTLTKQMRHDLASALLILPQNERLMARNTVTDVGTVVEGPNEYRRTTLADVLGANFSRLQESLRSLEEYGKIVAPQLARTAEWLRYQSYTLQKVVLACAVDNVPASHARKKLSKACLYVLLDCRETEAEFAGLVQAVLQGGADVIQLRDKQIGDRRLLQCAKLLRDLTAGTQTLMIVNDRPDIALLSRADGVHIGQDELTLDEVRQMIGVEMLVGVSTHSIEQARQAIRDRADYLGAGPVFPSATKEFTSFPGTDFLKQIAVEITLPVFAIGGINLDNLSQVTVAGLQRIAVQAVVTESQNPTDTCVRLKKILEKCHATDY